MNIDDNGRAFIAEQTESIKRFTTTRLIQVAGVSLALTGLGLFGLFKASEYKAAAPAGSGDTPVVLVGGSLDFKSGAQSNTPDWNSGANADDFFVKPGYSITKIAVKSHAPDDNEGGGNPGDVTTSDRIAIDISDADSWQIDAFTVDSSDQPVATVTQDPSTKEIHVVRNKNSSGIFCNALNKKRVNYKVDKDCSKKESSVQFDHINVTVNKTLMSTLKCKTLDGNSGKCRIALMGGQ